MTSTMTTYLKHVAGEDIVNLVSVPLSLAMMDNTVPLICISSNSFLSIDEVLKDDLMPQSVPDPIPTTNDETPDTPRKNLS